MNNLLLEKIINKKLKNKYNIKDYAPNGLQVEGCAEVYNIVTGVTACQKLLKKSLEYKAHAIIVHHGYFWKNETPNIIGMKRNRLKILLENNINLYSWHLPLDLHPNIGNNILLGKSLNISVQGHITPLVLWGCFKKKISARNLFSKIKKIFNRTPFYYGNKKLKDITRVAWCTGRGQNFIKEAIKFNIDTYITGEVSEETIHIAEENNIHFFSLGHHATEKSGIYTLGQWLSQKYRNLNVNFIDINNPI
ncbi:Nif3-like dinuclear metal center hexameric protein [Buchnera aphidicola]|uniref:Nif3-like dinuclear metal center hexameric protein n=1 Tax=Buchnera aphidicola TaxID=9 RepID=UPI00094D18E4|nr:Nif3-like dinuclear metal center hexameric protein [Buchnera aphidicola]